MHGKDVGTAKLTEADVLTIRQRIAAGESQLVVATDYPVNTRSISNIILRKTWAHI